MVHRSTTRSPRFAVYKSEVALLNTSSIVQINFVPSLMEVAAVIGNISNILLEPLKDVSRLTKKFKIFYKSPALLKLYKQDKELIELQRKLNNGRIIKLAVRLPSVSFPFTIATHCGTIDISDVLFL